MFYAIYYFILRIFHDRQKASKKIIKYNNRRVLYKLKSAGIRHEEILLLVPHCLQNSKCAIRITTKVSNCIACGGCKIGELVKIAGDKKLNLSVAMGGTSARNLIKKVRPSFVLAVACERDLISGIVDSFPLPVYGILNKQPKGYCHNTDVEISDIVSCLERVM